MQSFKRIIIFAVIMAMLLSAFPLLDAQKGSPIQSIALREAIINVRAFIEFARDEGGFDLEIKKALTSLRVAAGLIKTIQSDDADGLAFTLFSSEFPLLANMSYRLACADYHESVFEPNISYQSLTIEITPPPPRV